MQHVDPDLLALAALGEPLRDDADRDHLELCDECRAELDSLAAVVAVGRASTPGDALVAPPAATWTAIAGELGLRPDVTPDAGLEPRVEPVRRDDDSPGDGAEPGDMAEPTDARVVQLADRPRRVAPWVAGAAAAGVLVGGVGGGLLVDRLRGDAPATVVAEAALDPLPGWSATGEAVVEQADDGTRVLVLTVDEAAGDGFREVWLIDRDVTRLVSLGVLEGSEGRFTVPAGLDLEDFAVVDVSEEPFDGDPAHSGDSIVRGVLGT